VQIILAPDLAVVHAFVTYTGQSAEGKELRAMQNRLTWALKQQDGGWKIVHEHTSAPVDFETSKVLLQR
jgi:ketosteroid isomerase-like protein